MAGVSTQGGLFDVTLEDAELEDALEEFLADKEHRTASAAIAKRKKEAFEKHASQLKPGQRVRVGSLCFEVSLTERDSYEVEAVSAKGMRRVRPVSDAEA